MTTLERPRLTTEERNRTDAAIGWIEGTQRAFGGVLRIWRRHLPETALRVLEGLAADLEGRRQELFAVRDGIRPDRQPQLPETREAVTR